MARPIERPEEPAQKVDGGDESQEDVPEPDEDEELLVEEVDSEGALHYVVVHAGLVANLELTQRHSGEPLRVTPVFSADEAFHDVDAIEVEVDLEEEFQQEELSQGVAKVAELDGHVARDEVVAVQFSTHKAAELGDNVLDAHDAAGPVLTLHQ